ncbi:hypothetical protein [Pseudomonas cremoricolorata]|uniref:hypothetical protein n=1 Tax=Pseudomonas cremoricolorata TaxID=157783 RepID=UPI0003F561CC|nr:hypothetical protein [Pseudomonas cremoricolorata]
MPNPTPDDQRTGCGSDTSGEQPRDNDAQRPDHARDGEHESTAQDTGRRQGRVNSESLGH